MSTSDLVDDDDVPLRRAHVRLCRPDLVPDGDLRVVRHFVVVVPVRDAIPSS